MTRHCGPLAAAVALSVAAFAAASQAAQELKAPETCGACATLPAPKPPRLPRPRKA